jgi:hypothetical protein
MSPCPHTNHPNQQNQQDQEEDGASDSSRNVGSVALGLASLSVERGEAFAEGISPSVFRAPALIETMSRTHVLARLHPIALVAQFTGAFEAVAVLETAGIDVTRHFPVGALVGGDALVHAVGTVTHCCCLFRALQTAGLLRQWLVEPKGADDTDAGALVEEGSRTAERNGTVRQGSTAVVACGEVFGARETGRTLTPLSV